MANKKLSSSSSRNRRRSPYTSSMVPAMLNMRARMISAGFTCEDIALACGHTAKESPIQLFERYVAKGEWLPRLQDIPALLNAMPRRFHRALEKATGMKFKVQDE